MSGIVQSISSIPTLRRNALVRENGRLPKNPLLADNGLGCGEQITWWRDVSISGSFDWA